MKKVQKIVAFSIGVWILLSSIGVVLQQHICTTSGHISFSLYDIVDDCCHTEADSCFQISEENCCNINIQYVINEYDIYDISTNYDLNFDDVFIAPLLSLAQHPITAAAVNSNISIRPPPILKSGKEISIAHQVFLC